MPSPRKRRLTCGCLALVVLVLLAAAVGAGAWFLSERPQARPAVLPVRIRIPTQGSRLVADRTHGVLVEATGATDLARFELWVDGQLVASQAAQADPLPAAVQLAWRPEAAGPHILVARAFERDGTTGRSRPVVVDTVGRPTADTFFVPATLEPGQTLDDLAAAAGISPQAIADANPGLPDSPPDGSTVIIPVPADALPGGAAFDDGPPAPEADAPPSPAPEPGQGLPARVDLQAEAGRGCEARLTWTGGEGADSLVLSAFGPGDVDFAPIAELQSDLRSYTDIVPLPATYTYVVQASNAAGLTESNLVALELTDECEVYEVPPEPEWTAAQFEALELITEAPFDRLYCYLGLGASRYVRVPADDDEFLTSPDGLIWDIERYASGIQRILFHLDPEDVRPAAVECWGWQGASLSFLGSAAALPGWQPGMQDLTGPGFRLLALLDTLQGIPPMVPVSLMDPSIPAPYDLGIPANAIDCSAHISWVSGQEIEGGERRFMQWICADLTADTLEWEWQESLDIKRGDLTGFRAYVNRDYAADPREDDPSLAGWEVLGDVGSALQVYPIPRPTCGQTYGYKAQAFIEAVRFQPDPRDFRELPPIPLGPERVSEPSETFVLAGGDCPTPRVLVEIALDTVTVHNTWDECIDIDFECEDVSLEAYGEGTWLRQDSSGSVTTVASMSFWNERSTCGGFGHGCTTSHGEGNVRAHDTFLPAMERIDTCTPESGCTGYGVDHHRFQTWIEDGDSLSFNFTWWDHDDVSGDDIWCGTVDDATFGVGTTNGLGMTSFILGPFDWDTWAGFDHRHADNPWANTDYFRHQDAECEIDIDVTALEVEGLP